MPQPVQTPETQLKSFISDNPTAKYTFDSERGAPVSEVCRQDGKCKIIQMDSKKMFAKMQDLGFFCALPMDPTKGYIECIPIPK